MCDIRRVESVQRKFTKRLPSYRDLSYADRRKLLELNTLEQRRLKFDLVMCYKTVFGLVKLEFSEFFCYCSSYNNSLSSIQIVRKLSKA